MTVERILEERKKKGQDAEAEAKEKTRIMPWLRGLTFVGAAIFAILALTGDVGAWGAGIAGGFALAFVAAVRRHRQLLEKAEAASLSVEVNAKALDRLQGRWHHFPKRGEEYAHAEHPYAFDLDIVGQGSLFQRLSTASTRFGEKTLASWLLEAAPLEEIQRRQRIVADLRGRMELRQEMEAEGLRLQRSQKPQSWLSVLGRAEVIEETPDPSRFIEWAESSPWLPTQAVVSVLMWILPPLTLGLLFWQQFRGGTPLYWILLAITQWLLVSRPYEAIHAVFTKVSFREQVFSMYAALFSRIDREATEDDSPFRAIQNELRSQGVAPHREMLRLQRFIDLADVRLSPLLHLPLNIFLMWDLHVLRLLEAWQGRVGPSLRAWFDRLGEIEALASLATFAEEETHVCLPDLDGASQGLSFQAEALGHPLLPASSRICNDLRLSSEAPLFLITGSNMSGKSTLLRAIGINAVLAYAGSVVIARKIRLSQMQVATSMRIKDSLEQGVSFFMAELHRIRRILDFRKADKPLLYLLDEILHGTNTVERRVAAIGIIAQLLEAHAIGCVSTHDMELAELCKQFETRVGYGYLSDQIEEDQMRFDYILRQGICPTTNALKLLRIVGIEIQPGLRLGASRSASSHVV